MSVILCYGDSNTHGTRPMVEAGVSRRYALDDRWPEVMAQRLGGTHQVLSEGLPGRTCVHDDHIEGGARNGLAVLPAALHSHKPIDVLILMLGTNDLKPRFSVSSHEIARSVERLVLSARAEGVVKHILVVAPAPVAPAGCLTEVFAGAVARQAGLETYLQQIATRHGCRFVEAGAHVAVSAQDGVHWEAAAHHRFGAIMADEIRELLP